MAFVYFDEENRYNVYTLANPRGRKRRPWQPIPRDSALAVAATTLTVPAPAAGGDTAAARGGAQAPQVGEGGTIYRTPQGFRAADALQTPGDTTPAPAPVSIVALLDSATLALPDTSEFTTRPYRTRFTPDYVARPSIGYTRDNFGRGVFGGSAISLSDMLGNQQLVFAGYVNGRITEAQVLAAYANYGSRLNWAAGVQQDPYFFLEPSEIRENTGGFGDEEYVTNIRRLVVRSLFAQASYPFSRFQRVEIGARVANVDDARLRIVEPFDASSGFATAEPFLEEENLQNVNYVQPTAALVFDNTLFGYVGPFFGRRYRFEAGYNLGSWKFAQLLGDFRRYDRIVGPVVFATRALYFGRIGRDADQFRIFGGSPDLIRGNTSGSYRRNECSGALDPNTQTGCAALDQLVGTQIAVASAELRFPILPAKFGVPIEGAAFYDVGVVWDENTTVKLSREAGDDPITVRTPLQTAGLSLRANVLGFVIARFDWNFPIKRPGTGNFWTISLGPTF